MTNSPPNTPNGNHHHVFENHNQEDQLELTLGYPSSNTNEPPAPIQQHHNNNNNNNNHYHHIGASPTLQPFFFRSLSTHFAPSVPVSSPVIIKPPSSSANPPRRQKQARASSSTTATKDKEKSETITPPYPWATDRRCGVQTLAVLRSHGHVSITGRVKCRKCERGYEMAFDLEAKFCEVASFLVSHKDELRHRAPEMWMNPSLPECVYCRQKNAVRPEIEAKKKNTNWLFLFLGQMMGCCTGEQLKYFCKHVGHHRTAAKDRLLYLAYLGMCNQLDPHGPFDL